FHGFNLNLSKSSFWMTPNVLAFRSKSSNPFEGIPYLEDMPNPGGVDIQGYIKTDGSWHASFDVEGGIVGAMSHLHVEAGSQLNGFKVSEDIFLTLPGFGTVDLGVSGTIFENHDYALVATAQVDVFGIDGTLTGDVTCVAGHRHSDWNVEVN